MARPSPAAGRANLLARRKPDNRARNVRQTLAQQLAQRFRTLVGRKRTKIADGTSAVLDRGAPLWIHPVGIVCGPSRRPRVRV